MGNEFASLLNYLCICSYQSSTYQQTAVYLVKGVFSNLVWVIDITWGIWAKKYNHMQDNGM